MSIPAKFFSKKLIVAALTVLGLVLQRAFGLEIDEETRNSIVGVVMAYLVGQGLADFGKGRVREEVKVEQIKAEEKETVGGVPVEWTEDGTPIAAPLRKK